MQILPQLQTNFKYSLTEDQLKEFDTYSPNQIKAMSIDDYIAWICLSCKDRPECGHNPQHTLSPLDPSRTLRFLSD
jgi:hypothetical protein